MWCPRIRNSVAASTLYRKFEKIIRKSGAFKEQRRQLLQPKPVSPSLKRGFVKFTGNLFVSESADPEASKKI